MKRREHGSDVCFCGDYRSQHRVDGCGVCVLSPPFMERCKKFKWGRKATAEETAHWQKYHGEREAAHG
jgi:hypothetical protein